MVKDFVRIRSARELLLRVGLVGNLLGIMGRLQKSGLKI